MSYYILNSLVPEEAAGFLRAGMWTVDADEPHGDALAAGDRVLIYLGAPNREFIGRAEVASTTAGGVLLAHIDEWRPPVPMDAALAQLRSNPYAKGDFDTVVVLITEHEYEVVLALVAGGD